MINYTETLKFLIENFKEKPSISKAILIVLHYSSWAIAILTIGIALQ